MKTLEIELRHVQTRAACEGVVHLTPRECAGWRAIRHKGKRYQLFGGVHTSYFIDLDAPIKPNA